MENVEWKMKNVMSVPRFSSLLSVVLALERPERRMVRMGRSRRFYESDEGEEVLSWWSLTPAQRFAESEKLWITFRALGGSLDPEPDWQSPFYFAEAPRAGAPDGRPGVHPVRGRRVQSRRRHRRSG